MDETYRILGQEHRADLEREVDRRRLAAIARGTKSGRTLPKIKLPQWKRARVIPARLAGFLR
jgi:hypothetical protein